MLHDDTPDVCRSTLLGILSFYRQFATLLKPRHLRLFVPDYVRSLYDPLSSFSSNHRRHQCYIRRYRRHSHSIGRSRSKSSWNEDDDELDRLMLTLDPNEATIARWLKKGVRKRKYNRKEIW